MMSQPALRCTVCGLAGALLALGSPSSFGQEKKGPPKVVQQKVSPSAERLSGVIIKAEPVGRARPGAPMRLTINTAAVWRDWARDQVTAEAGQSPSKAAERGANSVATKGEPESKDQLVVIQLAPDSKVETRFRTLTDETGKGAATPAGARAGDRARDSKSRAAKPVRFEASDLKPGLFVEADFRRAGGDNVVSTVSVIRPVSDPASTANPVGK